MKSFRYFLTLIIISAMFLPISAQEDVLRPKGKPGGYGFIKKKRKHFITIGAEAGANFNIFYADMAWDPPYENSAYRVFESGFGVSPYFAGMVDFAFTKMIGLQVKLAADMKSISNTETGFTEDVNFGQTCEVEYGFTETGTYLGISALFRLNLNKLVLLFGPVYQEPLGKFDQEFDRKIIAGGCTFLATGTDTYNTTASYSVPSRFGIEAGAGYRIPISKKLWLVPQARLQLILTKHGDDETNVPDDSLPWTSPSLTMESINKTMHSIVFSVALWFEI